MRRETVSRALADPDGPFSKELARLRAAATATTAPSELVEKAQRVLGDHLDSQDPRAQLDAAKTIMARLAPEVPPEPPPDADEEATPEAAVRELIATLPTLHVVLRQGQVPSELVDELRQALRQALSDLEPVAVAAAN